MTCFLLRKLVQGNGLHCVQEQLINYADDYRVSWIGGSEMALYNATCEAAEIFSLLESFGRRINLGKSAAILKVVKLLDPILNAFQKNLIRRRSEGVFLRCASRDGKTYRVPIVKQRDYLGSVLSYSTFATETVTRRVKPVMKLKSVFGSRRLAPDPNARGVRCVCPWRTDSEARGSSICSRGACRYFDPHRPEQQPSTLAGRTYEPSNEMEWRHFAPTPPCARS